MDDIKLQIKNLKKAKRYNEIYKLYGSEAFLKSASVRFKKEDIKKLADEKRYFERLNRKMNKSLFFINGPTAVIIITKPKYLS